MKASEVGINLPLSCAWKQTGQLYPLLVALSGR